jgi:subtilisin family serine protease
MACPHVAGAAAKLLSGNPGDITPKTMKELLARSATENLIEGLPSNNLTPNKLLFADCS